MTRSRIALTTAALCALATAAPAQHASHAPGAGPEAGAGAGPLEPGQGAFAAIAEIVALLASDPATDWSRVDIAALQAHLADMDAVVMDSEVAQEDLPDGLRMTLSRDGRAGVAAARMVPAHGPVLAAETGWLSEVESGDDALTWTVRDPSGAAVEQIRALGFFGLMATGAHHQPHHMALARGAPMH